MFGKERTLLASLRREVPGEGFCQIGGATPAHLLSGTFTKCRFLRKWFSATNVIGFRRQFLTLKRRSRAGCKFPQSGRPTVEASTLSLRRSIRVRIRTGSQWHASLRMKQFIGLNRLVIFAAGNGNGRDVVGQLVHARWKLLLSQPALHLYCDGIPRAFQEAMH